MRWAPALALLLALGCSPAGEPEDAREAPPTPLSGRDHPLAELCPAVDALLERYDDEGELTDAELGTGLRRLATHGDAEAVDGIARLQTATRRFAQRCDAAGSSAFDWLLRP